ncbi:cysteine--tRNA ligase, partial [Sarracenia purpurea var. burkii]
CAAIEREIIIKESRVNGITRHLTSIAMARKSKDFKRGDVIRSEVVAKGIALMDLGKETMWRP